MLFRHKKFLTLITALVFLMSMVGAAFAGTVYVGNLGFDTDKLDNDANYLAGFQSYLAANINDNLIVDAGAGIIFDANAFSNAPEGTNIGDFAAANPAIIPDGAAIWDGTGEPGVPTTVTVTGIEATKKLGDFKFITSAATTIEDLTGKIKANDGDVTEILPRGDGTDLTLWKATIPDAVAGTDYVITFASPFVGTATINFPKPVLPVSSVSAIEDINVDFGTAVEAIAFPAKVTLNLSDETTVEVDATFACDNYDGNVAGEYVFTATYELPEGVTGDKPVATVKVIVGADPQIAIEAAAEEAVAAYEAAPITTLEEITAAEALEVTANEKVALVTDADKKAAFETRIAAQKALVDAKKAELTALAVESVSAITKTSATVVLAEGADATAAAIKDSYTVKIGEDAVAVTAVSYTEATRTAVLTVDLDTKAGIVSVNGTAATASVDYVKPTISKVEALNNKTILVTFSEEVDATTALNVANYTIYNKTTGQSDVLAAASAPTDVEAVAAFANTEKTQVKISIISVGANVTGYPVGGLSNVNYILYVSNVKDAVKAPATANTIVAGSPYEFTGTLTPDTAGANLLSATFNKGSGDVALQFDKAVTVAAPTDDKVYFQAGTAKVLLKNATDYTGIAGASGNTQITFTVDTIAGTGTLAKINALVGEVSIVVEKGAFTDGTNESTTKTVVPTITAPPVLTGVTYDENANTAVYKFSKTIDVTKITAFQPNKFMLAGLDIYGGAPAGATFKNTANGTDLIFKLSDANAQLVEAAFRAGTKTASVAVGTVQDTDATPNTNVLASSTVTLADTDYTKDETAPTFVSAKYNGDSKVLELTFSKATRATLGDYVLAGIEFYQDDNGTAGLQTTGTTPDTKLGDMADFDKVGTDALLQADFRKADLSGPATPTDEMVTLYITDQAAIVTALDAVLDAVAANTDMYVLIKKDAVKDPSGNKIAADTAVKVEKVAVSNTSAITNATAVANVSLGEITVNFSNGNPVAMDATLATNPANYDLFLVANPLNKVAIKNIVMETNNTVARIFFSSPVAAGDYALKTSGLKTASGVASDIGGTTAWPSAAWTAVANATILNATQNLVLTDVDKSGTVSAGDTVKLVFSEAVKLPAGFAISDIKVLDAPGFLTSTRTLGNSTFALGADNKTLTITLGSAATLAVGDKLSFPATIKDFEDIPLVTGGGAEITNVLTVAGNVAPKIKSAVYTDTNADGVISTGDTLAVKFDQNLAIEPTKTAVDLVNDIYVNGKTTSFNAASLSGDTVSLTVYEVNTFAIGDTVRVNATPNDVNLVNSWGTKAADGVGKAVTPSDTVAPTVTGISYTAASHALTFTFSKAVNIETKTSADALAAALALDLTANGGSLGGGYTAATLSADKKSVTITLNGTEAIDEFVTITIAAGTFGDATNNIQDASGNIAVRGQGTPYAITIVQ